MSPMLKPDTKFNFFLSQVQNWGLLYKGIHLVLCTDHRLKLSEDYHFDFTIIAMVINRNIFIKNFIWIGYFGQARHQNVRVIDKTPTLEVVYDSGPRVKFILFESES
ncbi:hypothetical protein [Maribacter halichondriae]|uniref:hypothetical protein n=1 Tax=Maribacter halichondriae TaxID=2980554 RepID=UPI002359487E|nr:hypothetical protein [Maribacter sp. Hal144]